MTTERKDFPTLPPPPFRHDDGGSIVDLAASVARRFGAPAQARGLAHHAIAGALAEARCVVLLLFDGLGERQVASLIPDGALAAARSGSLSSVFPSSTAPAISCFASALYPLAHGVPGWYCWSEALGAIVRSLPMDVRGAPECAVEAETLLHWRSASASFRAPVLAIQPESIADSRYSRHAWSGATRIGYRSGNELVEQVEAAVRRLPEGGFVWAYLPEFDGASHEHGWQSEKAAGFARGFDTLFARLAERLRDTDALLLATADHGFVDVPPASQLRLEDFPELAARLARPLWGEPRVAFCQARQGEHEAFVEAAREALGFAFEVAPCEALLAAGWFGPCTGPSPLAARLGSHALIGRELYTLSDRVPGERESRFVGMHGGTHRDELRVPLAAVRRGLPLRE